MSTAEPDTRSAVNGSTVVYRCPVGYVFDHLADTANLYCDGKNWQGGYHNCIGMADLFFSEFML